MIEALAAGLRSTTPLEASSVALGLLYALLAVRRIRWCWLAGGLSSAILVYLAARAQLPMQSALQAYYVGMAAYGFWHWSGHAGAGARPVSTLPLRAHAAAWAAILLASALTARWLAAETQAAWPYLDSLTTWASLFTTWLVARMKLENWLYWIAIDSVLVFLFAAQGLYFVALLFAAYLLIAVVGFFAWLKAIRPAQAT